MFQIKGDFWVFKTAFKNGEIFSKDKAIEHIAKVMPIFSLIYESVLSILILIACIISERPTAFAKQDTTSQASSLAKKLSLFIKG